MIVDFHTHIYPERVAEKAAAFVREMGLEPGASGTPDGLLASMDAAGIDLAVGATVVTSPEKSRSINDYAIACNHGRLRMFGGVHPSESKPLETLERIAGEGLFGVKVHPEYQHFDFEDESLYPIWEKCIELRLPLLTHAGYDIAYKPPFRTCPEKLAAFHRRFPELVFVAAHFGSYRMWDEVEEHLIGTQVYLDLSMVMNELPPERVVSMIRRHGAEKVLFATDSPWDDQTRCVKNLENLGLTPEEFRAIAGENALRLLAASPGGRR
ncbi:MAG: amidohydrolase family protein [Victivallaceae bacterium]|nr:amidohydrolase family protein [Victivallaceae bacterium]